MHKILRVIHVVNVRWYNATAWYALSLAGLLADAGHEVRVIALPGTEAYAKAEKTMKSSLVGISLNTQLETIRTWRALQKITREFRPHIVNCHRGEGMVLWGMLKALGGGFSLVRTRGDQRAPKYNPVNRYLYATVADAVIATNSRTLQQCSLLGVPVQKLHLIPGGVDRTLFSRQQSGRARMRAAYGLDEGDVAIGLLGRFDPVKGHRELMDALALMQQRLAGNTPSSAGYSECSALQGLVGRSRVRLLLAGFAAGISLEEMETMLRERGLERCSVVTGKVDDVPALISAMDVGVVASQGSEAIARAAFEIMSCGVPLIGTDVGVMPDLLGKEALAPAGDTAALSSLVERVVYDGAFREHLVAAQAARMPDFSHEAFLEQSLEVYRAALGGEYGRRGGPLSRAGAGTA